MSDRKQRPQGDVAYIDEGDRQRIIERMREKDISRADLARECKVTPSAITLLLRPIRKGETRGCKFMADLQRALGMVITAKRPTTLPRTDSQRAERVLGTLSKMDRDELEHWLADGEYRASKLEDK